MQYLFHLYSIEFIEKKIMMSMMTKLMGLMNEYVEITIVCVKITIVSKCS